MSSGNSRFRNRPGKKKRYQTERQQTEKLAQINQAMRNLELNFSSLIPPRSPSGVMVLPRPDEVQDLQPTAMQKALKQSPTIGWEERDGKTFLTVRAETGFQLLIWNRLGVKYECRVEVPADLPPLRGLPQLDGPGILVDEGHHQTEAK